MCICFYVLQTAMKRVAVGIWGCKACKKVQAGGAYVLK
jgi:large subunit ribosomal protein L37Ae